MTSEKKAAYRNVLRSTSIVGGATAATLVIGLVRTKVLALMLGPTGIGLIGLWTAVMNMGSAVAGMGLHSSGVRQIAASADDPPAVQLSLRALWTLSIALALFGGAGIWLLRAPISNLVIGDARHAGSIGWIALGVSLSILASAQVASIQGFRRMGDFARLQLYSNLVAAVAGVSAVWILGEEAILFVVLATPVSGWLLGLYFARRLPHGPRRPFAFRNMTPIWRMLVRVGLAVAATAIISSVTQIAARTIVLRQFGLEGVGFFQAAWTISAVNMGLLLASMGADYYPRLSAAAHDDALITEHVNQQIHVGLVLAGPVLTGVTCLAPLVLQILYSSKFTEATHLLQWLTAADVLRLTGWSLGFVMLARQASLSFVAIEATFAMVFLPLMWWLAPALGLEAVGLAYFLGYFVCLLVSLFLAVTVQRVHVSRTNLLWTFLLTLLMLALIFGFRLQPLVATIFGLVAAAGLAIFALFEIHRMGVAFPVVGPLLRRAETILGSTRKAPPSP